MQQKKHKSLPLNALPLNIYFRDIMSSVNSLFAELGVPELRRELRAADPSPASRKSRALSSLIHSIDTQKR